MQAITSVAGTEAEKRSLITGRPRNIRGQSLSKPSAEIKEFSCYYCKEKSHRRFECLKLKKKEERSSSSRARASTVVAAVQEEEPKGLSSTVALVSGEKDSRKIICKDTSIKIIVLNDIETFVGFNR